MMEWLQNNFFYIYIAGIIIWWVVMIYFLAKADKRGDDTGGWPFVGVCSFMWPMGLIMIPIIFPITYMYCKINPPKSTPKGR